MPCGRTEKGRIEIPQEATYMMKVLGAVRSYTHLSLASFLNSDCFAPIPELIGELLKISVPL